MTIHCHHSTRLIFFIMLLRILYICRSDMYSSAPIFTQYQPRRLRLIICFSVSVKSIFLNNSSHSLGEKSRSLKGNHLSFSVFRLATPFDFPVFLLRILVLTLIFNFCPIAYISLHTCIYIVIPTTILLIVIRSIII